MDITRNAMITECDRLYLPAELKTNPLYDVRPLEQNDEDEQRGIEQMALSLEQEGQLETMLVTENLEVLIGHRRRKAGLLINERRSARGEPLFRLRVRIARGGDMRRKAIISNLLHKHYTPMQLAILIKRLREEKQWEGSRGTQKIADFLCMDRHTVRDYERFNLLEPELRDKLHNDLLTAHGAKELLKLPSGEERLRIAERAVRIQEAEHLDKVLTKCEAGKLSEAKATRILQEPAKTHIGQRAIAKAIRETCGTTPKAGKANPTRTEIVEAFTHFTSDIYPSLLRQMNRCWLDYANGIIDIKDFRKKVLAILPSYEGRKPARTETMAAS